MGIESMNISRKNIISFEEKKHRTYENENVLLIVLHSIKNPLHIKGLIVIKRTGRKMNISSQALVFPVFFTLLYLLGNHLETQ